LLFITVLDNILTLWSAATIKSIYLQRVCLNCGTRNHGVTWRMTWWFRGLHCGH